VLDIEEGVPEASPASELLAGEIVVDIVMGQQNVCKLVICILAMLLEMQDLESV
jgi:hypothetical protein